MPNNLNSQKGFTLIELMIAITLGLIISAAALMIFLSSQRSLAMQAGMGDIQQNTVFGLSSLTHDLRHANLDTGFTHINNTNNTGIDFSQSNSTGTKGVMKENSDVLTIRYRAREGHNTDCAGTTNIADGTVVTHRYHIDKLPKNQQSGGADRYGLICQSSATPNTTAVVIPDAESFKTSLLIRNTKGTPARTDDTFQYVELSDYTSGNVVAIEVGVVIRSSNSVQSDSKLNQSTFTIAGQTVTLNSNDNRHLRTPITQVIALRNAQEL